MALLWLICTIFLARLKSSCVFWRFFVILDRLLEVLGGFSEGFGVFFSMFFGSFLKIANLVKYSILPRKNHGFLYIELLKNNKIITKNPSEVDTNFE